MYAMAVSARAFLPVAVFLAWACTGAPPPRAPRGVVSSATPEATAAGVEILELGGNAVEAAIAVAFALGVTEPAGSGIGGQAMLLIHGSDQAPVVINGTSLAPGSVPEGATASDLVGRPATTVPSMVKAMALAHRRFGGGDIPWHRLLVPAARAAERGFVLGSFRRQVVARYAGKLREDPACAGVFLGKDGRALPIGDLVRRPQLARTLRRLMEAGAEDFYRGRIARTIAADMRRNGGWIRLEDLATLPEPAVLPALHGTYRGYDVYTLPPPAGGWVVLLGLNVLEHAPPGALARGDSGREVWIAEALRAAHDARAERPVHDLVDFEEEVERKTAKENARRIVERLNRGGGGETTHFVVVDAGGMVVSASMSLNAYFGARVMHPELGFLYNDYMREFELGSAQHPFALRANAMPYSSMSATILAKNGRPVLGLGSPGSRRIISAVLQVATHVLDGGLTVQAAVSEPRMHVVAEDDTLMFEVRPRSRALLRELERRGFQAAVPLSSLFQGRLNPYFGGVHAAAKENGTWVGAADPRRDGEVAYTTHAMPRDW